MVKLETQKRLFYLYGNVRHQHNRGHINSLVKLETQKRLYYLYGKVRHQHNRGYIISTVTLDINTTGVIYFFKQIYLYSRLQTALRPQS